MLPFMAPKKLSSVVILKHKSDGTTTPSHEEGEHQPELVNFMQDLIDAIHSKDAQATADAFMAASHFIDKEPHEEGPHTEGEA